MKNEERNKKFIVFEGLADYSLLGQIVLEDKWFLLRQIILQENTTIL
jgi:hypothetical protein